jgi:hypothetical protein
MATTDVSPWNSYNIADINFDAQKVAVFYVGPFSSVVWVTSMQIDKSIKSSSAQELIWAGILKLPKK